ncbi:STAS domain-containing protein [Novosphingobium arvoryzae]|uniref:Anti-sigma factor antagonist n=1 Tax=Novosphingobium arvoryzae TaxID=1256514 RepID=A0A918R6B1_9SPHN|nr:STAS domain-containing protein [Novosphingobium arvoryzae]GGZ88219.1 anti-sigma factor antagonist [Novosphingobium arvoryzae]
MEIVSTNINGTLVVMPEGRIDSVTAESFQTALLPFLEDVTAIAIDGSKLSYVSSAGLRVFLMAAKSMKSKGGTLALFGLVPTVEEVFVISGFSKIIPIHPDLDCALAA